MIQEYEFNGQAWRVSRFDLLIAEFEGLAAVDLPTWHQVLHRDARAWLIVRRLHGVHQLFSDEDPLELRPRSRAELQAEMAITAAQLKQELEAARGRWRAANQRADETVGKAAEPPVKPEPKEEFDFKDPQEELVKLGFSRRLFERNDKDRTPEDLKEDVRWFYHKVTSSGLAKLLDHPMAGEMARGVLTIELQLRWLSEDMIKIDVTTKLYTDLVKAQDTLRTQHAKLLSEINRFAPWMDAERKQMTFANAVSELVRGIQEYRGKGSNELIDGMFTGPEIQFCLRTNDHQPKVRYRLGLVFYANMVRASLFDPKWKNRIPQSQWRLITEGFREAVAKIDDRPVTELQNEGPEGEYEPIVMPEEGE